MYLWVKLNLTDELDLQRNTVLSKPIAYRQDVTVILAALFSPPGLHGFMSMRMVLDVALFINLMVDSCGQAHEVVASEKYPNQYLPWRHLEIWVFKLPDGSVGFRGLLKVTVLKGMKHDPREFKKNATATFAGEALLRGHSVPTVTRSSHRRPHPGRKYMDRPRGSGDAKSKTNRNLVRVDSSFAGPTTEAESQPCTLSNL